MATKKLSVDEKKQLNAAATHPLQSYEWGEFRKKTGVKLVRGDNFQLTIHRIPHTPWNVGYLPKGNMPDKKIISDLQKIGQEENCIFIQLEPNVIKSNKQEARSKNLKLKPAAHPLFTRYNFVLDLTKSEDELLKNMHQKTRYNIRIAQKHDVEVVEDNSSEAFNEYLKLTRETTKRQGFFAHTLDYHKKQWETLPHTVSTDKLSSHLLIAKYKNKILAAWILFIFKDTLYYPYGASSSQHREVMASSLIMWEAIKFGKRIGLKRFDMWGALSTNPDKNDPWYGFHNFKSKYGPDHVEYIGSFDLIINSVLYEGYKIANKLRWLLLRFNR